MTTLRAGTLAVLLTLILSASAAEKLGDDLVSAALTLKSRGKRHAQSHAEQRRAEERRG